MNLREKLIKKTARKVEPVEIDGETFYVRSLPAIDKTELDSFCINRESGQFDKSLVPSMMRLWVLKAVCNEDGSRLFTDDELSIVEQLDPEVFAALLAKAQSIGKSIVEDAEKNSETVQG